MLEVIAERRFRPPGRLLYASQSARNSSLFSARMLRPIFRSAGIELDDLHLVALADLELELLVLAGVLRVVELGDVDQALDALVQLDERAEVGHRDDLALDDVADVVLREELVPDVGLRAA